MADAVTITAEGLEPLLVAFGSLAARLSDLRPAWPSVASAVRGAIKARFANEGPGWPGLSEAYAKVKEKTWGAQKTLHASGAMEASLTVEGAEGAIYEITPTSLTTGSAFARAAAHQEGAPERNLPQRAIIDESVERAGGDALVNWLDEYTRELGLAA